MLRIVLCNTSVALGAHAITDNLQQLYSCSSTCDVFETFLQLIIDARCLRFFARPFKRSRFQIFLCDSAEGKKLLSLAAARLTCKRMHTAYVIQWFQCNESLSRVAIFELVQCRLNVKIPDSPTFFVTEILICLISYRDSTVGLGAIINNWILKSESPYIL